VLTDFDGTLAPIVADPEMARPLPQAAGVLNRLSRHFSVVGVVSGRPAQFLAAHLAGAGAAMRIVGAYGSEWIEDGELRRAQETAAWIPKVHEVLEAARPEAPKGVVIEDKGASVTIHWRRNPGAVAWARSFASQWAHRTGLVVHSGRMVVELGPPIDIDKGKVVEDLARGCTAACFAGDDAGDLAAFGALDRMATHGVHSVKIAVCDEEFPRELTEAADVVVRGPEEALALLDRLAVSAAKAR